MERVFLTVLICAVAFDDDDDDRGGGGGAEAVVAAAAAVDKADEEGALGKRMVGF